MSETFYSLKNVSSAIARNGRKAEVTLEFHQCEPARFYMSFDGASVFASQMNALCQGMAKKLIETGEAESYKTEASLELEPYHFLSYRLATAEDGSQVILSVQTAEGPLVHLSYALQDARKLAEAILQLPDKKTAKGISIN
jgi:hypothetical protein